jgi:rhodanese-related sulfurtransferase
MGYAHTVVRDRLSDLGKLTVTRIGAVETLSRLRSGEPIVFVDARREDAWRRATEKLPGAVRLAPDRADETLPIVPAGHTAITYCTCRAEASSVAAAELLVARGYEDVHVLYGGLGAWRLVEGPMEPM